MTKKKFTGKIRTDPWEALALGPAEVMLSLWEEYLADILGAGPKSGRYLVLRREIDKAGGFREIIKEWPSLAPEARAEAWRQLVTAARSRAEAARESCVRCGECCERFSPTLLLPDLALFEKEVITWNEVYTLRQGELGTSREGKAVPLKEERLKIRPIPGGQQCWFYLAATSGCRIYEHRPEQCRRQQCWGEPAPEIPSHEFLNRSHLFARVPEVWDLIASHRERCDLERVGQSLLDLAAGREEAGDYLFEALHFDHYLRQMLLDDWELTPAATELILGRPLPEFLRALGYQATLTPEGTFRVEVR
ncbi:MAG: YkgJ family cysteine cluster protein [Thermodesulfobacteriota bacterium]